MGASRTGIKAGLSTKETTRLVRQIAAELRAGRRPKADPCLVRLAESHLRNRAKYNARRDHAREVAAQLRAGRKPKAAPDIIEAAKRHLAYREWYNADRRAKRRA